MPPRFQTTASRPRVSVSSRTPRFTSLSRRRALDSSTMTSSLPALQLSSTHSRSLARTPPLQGDPSSATPPRFHLFYPRHFIRPASAEYRHDNLVTPFIDLSKAFDSVNHEIILDKLDKSNMSTSVINWFKSYLYERSQPVTVGGNISKSLPLNTGVPQESILGPLLFIIYTSDLSSCLPLECKLFMYADESTITCSSSNINEIENNLNTALGRIYDWCVRNKLTINANKTKSMLIGSKQKVCNTDLNVSIAGSSVVQVNHVKCIGVIIDESLSWGPHVEYVKKTVSSNLGMLNRIRNCVPQSSLHSLFVCLVTPSLDYCCTVWGGLYIYHANILNKCLKRAARIILQCAFLTPSADMFSKLNWLSFSERVKI